MGMTLHEASIFAAGQDAGARVTAGLARLAALQLLDDAHWWNRWSRRLLAGALTALADEVEEAADVEAAALAAWSSGEAGEPRPRSSALAR